MEWALLFLRWGVVLTGIVAVLIYLTTMPGRSYSGSLPPLSPEEKEIQARLEAHVKMLGQTIGQRNLWYDKKLNQAADYIETVLTDSGYTVSFQEFEAEGKPVKNIEAQLHGTSLAEEIVVVGAHYDSVLGSPGANDNGSGVAGLLELARLMKSERPARTFRFVAFVNEEPPFFMTRQMGSWVYASRCRQREEKIVAMISLEMLGAFSDEPGSQDYPIPFSAFYPDKGNFIGFVSNLASRNLLRRIIRSFRKETDFPSEGLAAPSWMTGVGWSDHWAFWKKGYPAMMITDTAMFRYPYYHTPEDTPDKIDYACMAQVVTGLFKVLKNEMGAKK